MTSLGQHEKEPFYFRHIVFLCYNRLLIFLTKVAVLRLSINLVHIYKDLQTLFACLKRFLVILRYLHVCLSSLFIHLPISTITQEQTFPRFVDDVLYVVHCLFFIKHVLFDLLVPSTLS